MIKAFAVKADGCHVLTETETATGSSSNLNPDLLLSALFEKTGLEPVSRNISRLCLLNENGTEFC